MAQTEASIGSRLTSLLKALGIKQLHVGACMSGDWGELISAPGIDIASLALICPMLNEGMPDGLGRFRAPSLIVSGDQGPPAARAKLLAGALANSSVLTFTDYASPIWADAWPTGAK